MAESTNSNPSDQHASDPKQSLAIRNIYTRDISFESPNVPYIFGVPWEPRVDFDLQMSSQQLEEHTWEVMLNVTVKVTLKVEDKPEQEAAAKDNAAGKEEKLALAFLVEVKQAGVFSILGLSKEHADKILGTTVPSILFPYVREQVSNLVVKGGFPQLMLPPMNFETIYQQHLQKQKAAAEASAQSDALKTAPKTEMDVRNAPIISMTDSTISTDKH